MKTYQYSGLTKELHSRLVSEHAALREAHKGSAYRQFSELLNSVTKNELLSFTKHSTMRSWNVRGYRHRRSKGLKASFLTNYSTTLWII